MANSARNQPGVERRSLQQEPNPLDNIIEFYESKKNVINTSTTVILAIVVGYFAYTKLYKAPNEQKASTALSFPQLYMSVDSLDMALNGDGKNAGFVKIGKKYDGTAAGNLAHYYEGVCYMKKADYKDAITAFKDFDGKGTAVGNMAEGLLGEAYMESGDNSHAIESFKKASSDKDDVLVTPMYLYQLGLAYEAASNANEAKSAFKRIRDEYPKSAQARDVDKELARLGDLN